jgi:hypothetical protein
MSHEEPTSNGVKDDKKKKRSSKSRKSRERSRSVDVDRLRSREKRKSKTGRKQSRSKSKERDLTSCTDKKIVSSKKDVKRHVSDDIGEVAGHGSKSSLRDFPCQEKVVYLDDQEQPSVLESTSGRQSSRLSVYQQQKPERDHIVTTTSPPSRCDVLNYRARCCLKCLLHFRVLKFFQVVCAVYICIITFKGGLLDAETGQVVDQRSEERTKAGVILVNGTERAIVAESEFQLIAILIARISAWFMYPSKFSHGMGRL